MIERILRLDHSRDAVFERSQDRVHKADDVLKQARTVNDLARQRIIVEHEQMERAMRTAL